MKKVLIGVVVVALLGVIIFASLRSKTGTSGKKVYAEAASRRDITEVVKASGEVDARVKVNISSHLIGKVEKLYVEEGEQVQAGQAFLDLEKDAFVAQRDDWASRYAIARNDVEQARVDLADQENKTRRARSLANEGILTSEQLETADLSLASAQLRLSRAQQAVRQTEANLTKARDDLRKTTIYSPLTGRVVTLRAEEGEVVVSGTMNNPASMIATVADLSELLAVVDVDETEVAAVKLGQEADLKVDALPKRTFPGQVVEVGSSGYNLAGQPDVTFFQVKLLFAEPDPELRPGMSVRADIRTNAATDRLLVPIQAVVERAPVGVEAGGEDTTDAEEISVVFVIEDGRALQRPVETGLSDETHVAITSGLEDGEQVVTGPYRILRDLEHEDAVEIRKESGADEDDEEED